MFYYILNIPSLARSRSDCPCPPSSAPPRPSNPRQRLLDLLDDLRADLDLLDLDTVDGECYWRGCRLDLLERVEGFCATGLSSEPEDRFHHDDHEEPEEALAFLRQGLRRANVLYAIEARAASLYPRSVWRRLLEGERLAMRSAEAEVTTSGTGAQTLSLKIFSGAWTGEEVESEVRRQNPDRSTWLDDVPDVGPGGTVRLALTFAFADEARAWHEADRPHFPYVLVTIPLPGPPAGVISREYDALVCGLKGWHRALPGRGTRQEKEVALRTWTVGLLMFHGMVFTEAMRVVCQQMQQTEVSQARFGEDRQRVVARVPEAQAYLFVRKPVSLPRVKDRDAPIPEHQVPEDTAAP